MNYNIVKMWGDLHKQTPSLPQTLRDQHFYTLTSLSVSDSLTARVETSSSELHIIWKITAWSRVLFL